MTTAESAQLGYERLGRTTVTVLQGGLVGFVMHKLIILFSHFCSLFILHFCIWSCPLYYLTCGLMSLSEPTVFQ